jgi:hypothetical protein
VASPPPCPASLLTHTTYSFDSLSPFRPPQMLKAGAAKGSGGAAQPVPAWKTRGGALDTAAEEQRELARARKAAAAKERYHSKKLNAQATLAAAAAQQAQNDDNIV